MECRRCGGTGNEPDAQAIGEELRLMRQGAGVSQREMARLMGISPSYLCDLEQGLRRWDPVMQAQFMELVKLAA